MDWSTVALTMFAVSVLGFLFIIWLIYSLLMRIVRMFTRTTKKTAHAIRSPFPRNR